MRTPGLSASGVLLRLSLVVIPLVLLLATAGNWYAAHVSLPRYCEQPAATLQQLQQLLQEERVGERRQIYAEGAKLAERRPYLVAAKLLYLQPRLADEEEQEYLQRLAITLQQACR